MAKNRSKGLLALVNPSCTGQLQQPMFQSSIINNVSAPGQIWMIRCLLTRVGRVVAGFNGEPRGCTAAVAKLLYACVGIHTTFGAAERGGLLRGEGWALPRFQSW